MMEQKLCLSTEELRFACAKLKAAVELGFIEEAGIDALERRWRARHQEIREKMEKGEKVYGLTCFCLPAYLQYELTRFRLDFVSGRALHYTYPPITREEKEAFFRENQELFKRCAGDYFSFQDVEAVIEKRIREDEYYRYVQNLLCQCR